MRSTGCTVGTSWFASCTLTSAVSSRTAAITASASTRPKRSTPTTVTAASVRASASRTAECSTALVTTWAPGGTHQSAKLMASVPELQKTTSRLLRVDERGDVFTGLFERDARRAPFVVQSPRVAEHVLAAAPRHGVERGRSERRRRSVVEDTCASLTVCGRSAGEKPAQTRVTQCASPSGR